MYTDLDHLSALSGPALYIVPVPDCSTAASCSAVRIRRHTASPDGGAVALVTQNIVIVI